MNFTDRHKRTKLVLGEAKLQKLKDATISVVGLGGVGGTALEALARTGVGTLHIIDHDVIDESNLNRQIISLESNIGKKKTEVAANRINEINSEIRVIEKDIFLTKDNIAEAFTECGVNIKTDYILDCIDNVTAKLSLIEYAKVNNIPIISAMGTGNKLDPTMLKIDDIYKTNVCPLCKVMRKELKQRNINSLKVVYSDEKPIKNDSQTVGSVMFVPSTCGILMAKNAIMEIVG